MREVHLQRRERHAVGCDSVKVGPRPGVLRAPGGAHPVHRLVAGSLGLDHGLCLVASAEPRYFEALQGIVGGDMAGPSVGVQWLCEFEGAHCHVSRGGNKQVCSEQISFRLKGGCATQLPSIILSNLDSDLPFYLWWHGELHDPMDAQLWEWVDRLIYDSHGWKDFPAQMAFVETAQREAKQRLVLCDLNWTRLDNARFALAQFFDHPASHHRLAKISNVRIDFAPGFRSTAILFAGWLAAQLNWQIDEVRSAHELRFNEMSGQHIDVDLREHDGEPVHEVALTSGDVEFRVTYASCGDLLEVSRVQNGERRIPQLMPAAGNDPVSLISEELMRGGPHRVYLNALNCVRDFL